MIVRLSFLICVIKHIDSFDIKMIHLRVNTAIDNTNPCQSNQNTAVQTQITLPLNYQFYIHIQHLKEIQ